MEKSVLKKVSESELKNVSGGCISCCIIAAIGGCVSAYRMHREVQNLQVVVPDIRREILNNANLAPAHVEISMPEGGGNIDLNNQN